MPPLLYKIPFFAYNAFVILWKLEEKILFDFQTCVLTVEKVAFLLLFMMMGYALRRSGKLKETAIHAVSVLLTTMFAPCYTFRSLSQNFTVPNLSHNLLLVLTGLATIAVTYPLAAVMGRKLGKSDFEKKSLTYIYTFPNNGYFGYPVIENVFGQGMLGSFIVFCLPFSIANFSYGYAIFAGNGGAKARWKKALTSPMMLGCYLGILFGLTGLPLPSLLKSAVASSADCMSPVSMLLAGLSLGAFSPRELLPTLRNLGLVLLRLLGIFTGLAVPILAACKLLSLSAAVAGIITMPLMYVCLPVGLNCIAYPQSFGQDASDNARLCFLSFLVSIVTIPVIFSILRSFLGF